MSVRRARDSIVPEASGDCCPARKVRLLTRPPIADAGMSARTSGLRLENAFHGDIITVIGTGDNVGTCRPQGGSLPDRPEAMQHRLKSNDS